MVVGIITARGGSKGLPGKNMLDLGGKPLIEHTFTTAQACACLDRIILSTDIPEAVALCRGRYPKIEVPFVRPKELCTDDTSQSDVVAHLLDYLENAERLVPQAVVLLQPTSPFRRVSEIDAAMRTFQGDRCDSLLGVTRVLHHPADYLYRRQPGDMRFQWVMRSPDWRRRQDFPEIYFNTGALYICSVRYFRMHRQFFDESSTLFPMSAESALDIDTGFDLELARGWLAAQERPQRSTGGR
jgi:CMP-N-acetylneuraminic acid synthetase